MDTIKLTPEMSPEIGDECIHILDTETASLSGGIVEIAWMKIDKDFNVLDEYRTLVNPERPIDPGAQAIHGISMEDVADAPTMAQVVEETGVGKTPINIIAHNCLTGDHEVLTQEGWQRLDNLPETAVAAVWEQGAVTFEPVTKVVNDFSGEMLAYNTNFHKGVYTPGHRIIFTSTRKLLAGGSPVWEVLSAENFVKRAPNGSAVPCCGEMQVQNSMLTPLEARFTEMVRADANLQSSTVRFKFSKKRKIDRCLQILHELQLPFSISDSEGVTRISVLQCPLRQKVMDLLGLGKQKRLGSWVLRLSLEARKALVDESRHWDGHKVAGLPDSKRQIVVTSQHPSEVDWLQIAAVTSGSGAKVYKDLPNTRGFSRPDGVLSRVVIRPNPYVKTLERAESVPYVGKVYCLNTRPGFFLVRRQGAVWVTGNCPFDARMIAPYMQIGRKLCTLDLSRQYITGTTNHKLATLQTELGLSVQESHTALGDVKSVRDLLLRILPLAGVDLATLFARAMVPKMLSKMPWGMHAGVPIIKVPKSYRTWLLDQADIGRDLRFTLEKLKNI